MALLETARLLLRPLCEEDLPDLSLLYADPWVMRFFGNGPVMTREQSWDLLQRALSHWREYGFGIQILRERKRGRFVGVCGVTHPDEGTDAEFACALATAWWGQGFATEAARAVVRHALEVLRLPRVIGIAAAHNFPARTVMVKAGMTFRTTFRSDGVWAVLYSAERAGRSQPHKPFGPPHQLLYTPSPDRLPLR